MRILFLLLISFSSVYGQHRYFRINKKKVVSNVETYFSNVVTTQSGNTISVTLTTNISNQNQPPSFENVTLSGTEINGDTLFATVSGFYSPGGYPEGSHIFAWYRADNQQSLGTEITGAVDSFYVQGPSDVSKYIRSTAAAVQVGGINTTGTPVSSTYSGQIQDNEFNPLTDITWFTAHTPAGYTTGVWTNYGTGNNSTQNSSDAVPTATADGADFELSNNEELVLDQPGTQFSMPVEVWVRTKTESFNGAWARIIDWNGTQLIEQRNTGQIYLSGGSCAYSSTLGNWTVYRFVISGSANTSEFQVNNGTNKTNVAANTGAFGTSNGRIGANAAGTASRYDGVISHIFIKSGELSPTDQSNLWTWFETYFPYD